MKRASAAERALLRDCQSLLVSLIERCEGLEWTAVISRDGLELVSAGKTNEKLSVMAGTMQALAEGIAGEAELGDCREMIVGGPGGSFLVWGIRGDGIGLVLAGLARPEVTLGMLLASFKETGLQIATLMARPAR